SCIILRGSYSHFLMNVWRDRVEYPELKRVLANFYMQYRPHAVLIEDKASGQSLIQELRAGVELPDYPKKIVMPVVAIEPEGSKLTRAIRVSPQFEAGRVWLPEVAPWLINYESELFGFPLSTNDDQVDSTSQYLDWAHSHSINIVSASTGRRASVDADNAGNGSVRRRSRNNFGGYT
ncbi:phage terminase large subunit, partial [Idiomarina xiamenensis]